MAKKSTKKTATSDAADNNVVELKTAKKAKSAKTAKASKSAKKSAKAEETKHRGREAGSIHYKWVKKPELPWPSALENHIMDAAKAVKDGTSGEILDVAVKTGLEKLSKQRPIVVVNHVLGKMAKAGIIARIGADGEVVAVAADNGKKAKKAKKLAKGEKVADATVPAKAKKVKKAKKRVTLETTPATTQDAQDAI